MAARNAINVLIKLLGGPEMVSELEKLGKTGEKAIGEISAAANKVSLAKLGGAFKTFADDIATVGKRGALVMSGLAAATAAVAPAIVAVANAGAEAADKVGKAAQATGLTTKAYQELAFAAQQAGTDQEGFTAAMSAFNSEIVDTASRANKAGQAFGQAGRNIKQGAGFTVETLDKIGVTVTRFGVETVKASKKVQKATNDTRTAFDLLGISVRDSGGGLKSNERLLGEVADAFAKMPDGATKSAIAVKLFNRAGTKLIPFLNAGSKGLAELRAQAESLGVVFSDDQIRVASAYSDALDNLGSTARGLRNQLGLIFVPALTQAANAFRRVILQNRGAILAFANGAVKEATILVKDLILALVGDDANVQNQWIIAARDGIIQFGQDVRSVVSTVVLPAFKLVRDSAKLVTDAINGLFGTNLTGGQILLVASLTQLVGGFRLLRSTIFLTIEALAFFSRALVRNPWLLAITAVAGGIALWVTRTDAATRAMQEHQALVNDVGDAYAKAGGEVEKMTQSVRDRLLLESRAALEETQKALSGVLKGVADELAQFDGLLPKAADPIFELARRFAEGKLSIEEFQAAVDALAVDSPELSKLANQIAGITEEARKLSADQTASFDWIDLLSGKISDAEFQARKTGEAFQSIAPPPADLAKPIEDAGKAADETRGKVEQLGHQITVTKFGSGGMSKEVFDVVDGIARRADASKATLDGIGQSASLAEQNLAGVSQRVGDAVAAVPDALKTDATAQAVDSVTGDLQRIPEAAKAVAGETNAALSDVGAIDATNAQSAAQGIVSAFQSIPSQIAQIFANINALAASGFGNVSATVNRMAAQISAAINRILAQLRQAVATAQKLRAQASSGSGRDESGGPGLARGGHLSGGPGTSTSDSIPAWLSVGEFVARAKAVRYYGADFFHALNNMRLPKDFFKSARGFNLGGFVSGLERSMAMPVQRFAGGGMAEFAVAAPASTGGSGTPVHLHLPSGKEIVGMFQPNDVAVLLSEHASSADLSSAGRKPGWRR